MFRLTSIVANLDRRVDWFGVLDEQNRPLLSEREVLRNLQAIVHDADKTEKHEAARRAIGVLSTENRRIWSSLRKLLANDKNNASCLQIVDNALFIVCLDDAAPDNLADLCSNFLCGTYSLQNGEQVGTCTNRWYDKVWPSCLSFASTLANIVPLAASDYCMRRRRSRN